MLKSAIRAVTALVAAAVVASAMTVLHGASDQVSASAPLNGGKSDRLDIRAAGPKCSEQAWPYYEAGCVKDRRQAMNQAKAARIITADRVQSASSVRR